MKQPGILKIQSFKQRARLGVSNEERSYPQLVTLEISLELDMGPCCQSDNIGDTCDYLAVVHVVNALLAEYSWKLVEKMTFDIAGQILDRFAAVQCAEVTVTKHVTDNTHGFSTTVRRVRPQSGEV